MKAKMGEAQMFRAAFASVHFILFVTVIAAMTGQLDRLLA